MARKPDQSGSDDTTATSVPEKAAGQVVTPEQRKTLHDRAQAGEKLNVGELALVTGNLLRYRNLPTITTVNAKTGATEVDQQETGFSPRHMAAATLHGWGLHRHHTGKSMELALKDYEAALKAADGPPEGFLTPVPHDAAFSPHAPPVVLVDTALQRQPFTKKAS